MRTVWNWNAKWAFSKEAEALPEKMPDNWIYVNLPHTWNAIDGQDGGNDYYRGTCWYAKKLLRSDLPEADDYYLQFDGTNSSAVCYVNGQEAGRHDGGYSTWRVRITDFLQDENLICVSVDNSPNDRVYPQMADFTFYGGIYRDVSLIAVGKNRFDLDDFGAPGMQVTSNITGRDAMVSIKASVTGEVETVSFRILDGQGTQVAAGTAPVVDGMADITLPIPDVHLWNGRKDPYLYTAAATLSDGQDEIRTRFGARTYEIDPEKGFLLNGRPYPLRGVARHQDRKGIGNALLPEHHLQDMDLICETGATTIRLAHYQHSQVFYDLCDERGMVVWAEIPYISKHMPAGRENTISQLTELIKQNYNHPSIVVWGLSNEITMNGSSEDLLENHRILNDLAHRLDPTRKTAIACVSMLPVDDPLLDIPDVVSYNHYFGWYGGDPSMYGPWLDAFHKEHPNLPIGLSEYGCEALNWHSEDPSMGDYTEEYQAKYHEALIRQIAERPYLWATHVWNMFDFGADGRNEGGENGQNHKGLVTFDRTYRKDSFYAYKAWLSDAPFVHICGKRMVDRVKDVTTVTVYTNQDEVSLFEDGRCLGTRTRAENSSPFFTFPVPNTKAEGALLTAKAGDCTDTATIRKVSSPNPDYRMKEQGAVLNWFDITEKEGYFSLNDRAEDVLRTREGQQLFADLFADKMKGMGMGASSDGMMKMMGGFTVLRLMNLLGSLGKKPTKEELLALNEKLNQIPRA
ncbi:MAG: glycoside hydrolase family 2 TIM barrel-domain containing protein [Lachnospiraceae bacterium]